MKSVLHTFKRELDRIFRGGQARYLIYTTIGLAFCYVFFITLMKDGQPTRLPIAIVDHDGSYLSRRLSHEINATQGVEVVAIYDTHKEARESMQRGEIFAFLEIPKDTYSGVLSFSRPHIALYSNNAYLLSGSLSYRSLATISKLASGAVQREILRKKGYDEQQIMGLIQPIELDTHLISNPTANYQPYVLTTMLPGMLGLMVVLLTSYMIGTDRKKGTLGEWLSHGLPGSWIGKMLPYTLWFTLLGVLGNIIMYGWCGYTMLGNFWIIVLDTLLLVLAMQSTATFLAGLIPEPHLSTCVCAIYGTLAFTMSGFSYPVSSMPSFLQGFSMIFPLRHYYLAGSKVSMFGCGLADCWMHLLILFAFQVMGLVGLLLLHKQTKGGFYKFTDGQLKETIKEI